MKEAKQDYLKWAKRGRLLYQGGEAKLYEFIFNGRRMMLKWYGKEVRVDEESLKVLEKEKLPGIYRVVQVGREGGRTYIVYEFVDGAPSGAVFPAGSGLFSATMALECLRRVVAGLKRMKMLGVFHGDLNPANVLIETSGNPVLIDCGLVGVGEPHYAAPERFQGRVPNEKSDLYSLGMLLYFWISGKTLLQQNNFEGLAVASTRVDEMDVSLLLYGITNLSGEALSALEPLWKGLLRCNSDCRFEDLEELDENLEIALDKLGGFGFRLEQDLEAWNKSVLECIAKNNGTFTPIPSRKRFYAVMFGLAALFIILILLLTFRERNISGVDATGAMMLQKSRSLNVGPDENTKGPDMGGVLMELPTPDGEKKDSL
ncbi:MAG: phosphotransferase [Fibrobacteraceae bacterium]|nr:phosphotransferase [Fibrobacteraceae bacterium]